MKRALRRILLWFGLLNKRLFRKVGFLAILIAVPVLVLALSLVATQESGFLHIAVACEDPADPIAMRVVEDLTTRDSILQFVVIDSPAVAAAMVDDGTVEAAWILPRSMDAELDRFALDDRSGPVVKVIEQADNVFLKLTREKLFASLYPELCYKTYANYVLIELGGEGRIPEGTLEEAYDSSVSAEEAVRFAFADGTVDDSGSDTEYLVAPIRGLLALLVALAALASAMYLMQDESAGTFDRIPARGRFPFSLAYLLIPVADVCIAVLMALRLTGLFTNWGRELLMVALFGVACAVFADIVRRLLRTPERLGIAIPLLSLAMLALCPVFLNVRKLRIVQYLLPPFYYLHGAHSDAHIVQLAVYIIAAAAVDLALHRLLKRKQN